MEVPLVILMLLKWKSQDEDKEATFKFYFCFKLPTKYLMCYGLETSAIGSVWTATKFMF